MAETILHWVEQYGYIMIFAMLMLGILGVPVPAETIVTFAGYLVYRGSLHLLPTFIAAVLGSMCGISVSYALGRTGGNYLVNKYGHLLHITAGRIAGVHNWFDHGGRWALLFGYFFPGIRHLTALMAGVSKLRLPVFVLFAYTGVFIWTTTFISVGYVFGEEWTTMSGKLQRSLAAGSGIFVVLLLLYFFFRTWKRK